SLRSGRGPRIIVAMHEPDCSECAAYVTRLARRKTALEEWGARVSAVAERRPHGAGSDPLRGGQVELLLSDDPPAALGVTPPAVIVTDEWGGVFFSVPAGAGHDFPDPDEMIEWT